MPPPAPGHIRKLPNCQRSQYADDASIAYALPGQSEYQGVELRAVELQRATVLGPHDAAHVQAPGGQPHSDALVHQHLQAAGTPVGEQVAMAGGGSAKDRHHARQRGLRAAAHVQRFSGQAQCADADHRTNWRNHPQGGRRAVSAGYSALEDKIV